MHSSKIARCRFSVCGFILWGDRTSLAFQDGFVNGYAYLEFLVQDALPLIHTTTSLYLVHLNDMNFMFTLVKDTLVAIKIDICIWHPMAAWLFTNQWSFEENHTSIAANSLSFTKLFHFCLRRFVGGAFYELLNHAILKITKGKLTILMTKNRKYELLPFIMYYQLTNEKLGKGVFIILPFI